MSRIVSPVRWFGPLPPIAVWARRLSWVHSARFAPFRLPPLFPHSLAEYFTSANIKYSGEQ